MEMGASTTTSRGTTVATQSFSHGQTSEASFETADANKLLADFKAYLTVDRHSAERTVYDRTRYLVKYLDFELQNELDL